MPSEFNTRVFRARAFQARVAHTPSVVLHWFRPIVAIACLGIVCNLATAQDRVPLNEDGHVMDFERDIRPIFIARCFECHNAKEAKADFRIDDAETVLSYLEPGDAELSTMFADYMLSDDPDMMMPPPAKGGPLLPAELAMIRVWINEGANWPEGVTVSATPLEEMLETDLEAPQGDDSEKSLVERVWSFQGFFHPATVHFPIALFLLGGAFVVLGWKWPAIGTQVPLACLLIGSLTAIASTAMGWSFAVEEGYGSWTKVDFDSEVFWHRWSGVIVTVLSVVFALIALSGLRRQDPSKAKIWKSGLLLIAVLVGLVGHQGGELSYGKDFYPKAFRILFGAADTPEDIVSEDEAAFETPTDPDSSES
ncbi:c-type cytochrome domain-containing protein [Rhodopirellula sp. MGV]|uniref:c-type cytochrome domain-containing protein n=1 Tax=Rhodopirellula sp. MGV TaxID=2023130 RepID=UPI000B96E87E|nr:c-type cytochrome domain-containing protein [Rhodopirellula sp. MGV]OYP35769.1 cytochrome C [Rhodopirellula sp. MGV]PNY33648.1 cytochrome C [Rhodopirellula baltica]